MPLELLRSKPAGISQFSTTLFGGRTFNYHFKRLYFKPPSPRHWSPSDPFYSTRNSVYILKTARNFASQSIDPAPRRGITKDRMVMPNYLISPNHPHFEWIIHRLVYSVSLESSRAFFYGLTSYVGFAVYGLSSWTFPQFCFHVSMAAVEAWYFGANLSQKNKIEPRCLDGPCLHPAIPVTLMFAGSTVSFSLPIFAGAGLFGTEEVVNFVVNVMPEFTIWILFSFYTSTYLLDKLFHTRSFQLPFLPGMWLGKLLADYLTTSTRKSVGDRRRAIGSSMIATDSTYQVYQYSPIGSKHIRLLKVTVDERKRRAHCELISVALEEAPSYDAVSHRWGHTTTSRSLLVGDKRISITDNICDLLLAICPMEGTKYLWIDSICIDQANLGEKEYQIPLMGEIYANANEVVAFLGVDKDGARAANLAHCAVSHLLHTVDVNKEPYKESLPFKSDVVGWRSLVRLLENEYWSRTWIAQEIALAQRLRIRYGDATISWVCISAIFRHYYWRPESPNSHNDISYSLAVESPLVKEGFFKAMIYARDMHILHGRTRSLPSLVSAFCRHSATCPEDKVYALLGLSTDSQVPELKPDFTKSAWEVYARLTLYELKSQGCELINMAGLSKHRPGPDIRLPSWVPDLRNPPLMITTTACWGLNTRGYTAGGNRSPRFEVVGDGSMLRIHGVSIDTIRFTTNTPHQSQKAIEMMSSTMIESAGHNYIDLWKLMASRFGPTALFLEATLDLYNKYVPDRYPTPGHDTHIDRFEALWRTLCLDFDGKSHPADGAMGQSFRDFMAQAYRGSQLFSSESGAVRDGWRIGELANFWKHQVSRQWGRQFDESFTDWFGSNRQFAVSTSGYMALVPPGTEAGDILCVFDGQKLPYVLRPLKDTYDRGRYALWGEAFVYGVMRGEVAAQPGEWFEIR